MADEEKELEGSSLHGTDWEVVSPNTLTYAAAPSSFEFIPPDRSKDEELYTNDQGTYDAMFMSQHFAFPPNKCENLQRESNCGEISNVFGGEDGRCVEKCKDGIEKYLKVMHGVEFFDVDKSLSIHDMEFRDGKGLQELGSVGEQVLYDATGFGALSLTAETVERTSDVKTVHSSEQNVDSFSDDLNASETKEENKCLAFGLPCEAWWKRQAAYLWNHVKETNTFWSVLVAAAALTGFAFMGRQWQREKLQFQQQKWHFSISEEDEGDVATQRPCCGR